MTSDKKPQLHVSMLNMMSRCGIQFQRRYGARFGCWHEEEVLPPNVALATGSAVHKSIEQNMRYKMESNGSLLPREQVAQIARDEIAGTWHGGMLLTEDQAKNPNAVLGEATDLSIALSTLHYDGLAVRIQPVAVEEKFVIVLDGFPFDLSGQKDIREASRVRDTKTAGQSPSEHAAHSLQMAMYALSEQVERGKLPDEVCLDHLVKNKTPKIVTRTAVPDRSWINPLLRRVERATEIIESVKDGKGRFTPAEADGPSSWVCTAAYCGYHQTCPFYSGK